VGMKTEDAIKYFGGKAKLASALGIKTPSLYSWCAVVPFARQKQIEDISGGKLRAMRWNEFLDAKRVA